MISTKQLIYALAVAEHLHFKKAAQACHISQSALSTALAEMERQLGVSIFERDNKKVLITPIGAEILARAERIKIELEELHQLAGTQGEPLSYPLRMGVIPTIGPYLLPKVLPELKRQYPQLEVQLMEDQSHVLVEKVRRGDLDTAVLALPYPLEGLLSFDFHAEDFYWLTHTNDSHARQREITSTELEHAHLMLLKDGHCLKDHALDACRFQELSDDIEMSATSLTTLVQMVIAQMGTTLVPAMALEQLTQSNKDLAAVHLNEPGPHRTLAFIVRPNYARVADIERLVGLFKTRFHKKPAA